MLRLFTTLFVASALLISSISDSEARRRGGGSRGVYVPIVGGGGGGGSVERVVDLPDIPLLRRKNGVYVDLGYKHNRYSGGEWVGYIGSSREYLPLDEEQLKVLMLAGGLDELPPVPSRPARSWFWLILLAIGGFVILKKGLGNLIGGVGRVAGHRAAEMSQSRSAAEEAESAASWQNAHDAIAQAVAANNARSEGRNKPTAAQQPTGGPVAARAGFGLRGR